MSASLDFKAIRGRFKEAERERVKALKVAGKYRKGAGKSKQDAEALRFLKVVVAPQLEKGFSLLLVDDYCAKELGITTRAAKHLKVHLSSLGILFCPNVPKAHAQWTIWLVRSQYMTWQDTPKREVNRRPVEDLYHPFFVDLRREIIKSFFEDGLDKEFSGGALWAQINLAINYRLERLELNRELLRLENCPATEDIEASIRLYRPYFTI